jgi:Mg2+-importing ATPase
VSLASLSIPYLGSLASVFGFVTLSGLEIFAVLVIVAGYIAATETAKAWYYSKSGGTNFVMNRHSPANDATTI